MAASTKSAIRLVFAPEGLGRFTARLESTNEVVVAGTRQPLVDGARELLARGFDPTTPLTMRMEGKTYDSFAPQPICQWAKWTYTESEKHALKRQRWMPLPVDREGQKSGSEPLEVPEGWETENRFHGGAPQQPSTLLGAP